MGKHNHVQSPGAASAFPAAAAAERADLGIGDALFKGDEIADIEADFHQNPLAATFGAADAGIAGCAGVERGLEDGEADEALLALWAMGAAQVFADEEVEVKVAGEQVKNADEKGESGGKDDDGNKERVVVLEHVADEVGDAAGCSQGREDD